MSITGHNHELRVRIAIYESRAIRCEYREQMTQSVLPRLRCTTKGTLTYDAAGRDQARGSRAYVVLQLRLLGTYFRPYMRLLMAVTLPAVIQGPIIPSSGNVLSSTSNSGLPLKPTMSEPSAVWPTRSNELRVTFTAL
jgi:hypothetical protein